MLYDMIDLFKLNINCKAASLYANVERSTTVEDDLGQENKNVKLGKSCEIVQRTCHFLV